MSLQSKRRRRNPTVDARNVRGGNDLPANVIHIILSYLPDAKERAQKALISTSWLFAWNTYHYLIFNQADIVPTLNLNNSDDVLQKALDSYISVVDGAVSKYERLSNNETVKRLGLQLKIFDLKLKGHMDRWIQIALCHRVEDLTLAIDYIHELYDDDDERTAPCYTIPKEVFSNRFIQTLSLIGGPIIRFPFSSSPSGDVNINLSRLRSLSLSVPMDSAMLEKLILGCPLLEKLMFHLPNHIKRVRIPGHSRLKVVEVTRTRHRGGNFMLHHVTVDAPMLETFVLVNYGVVPCRLNLDSCQNFSFLSPHCRDLCLFQSVCLTYENIKEVLFNDAPQKLLLPDLDSLKFSGSMHQLNDSNIHPNPLYLQLIVKNSSKQCQVNIKLCLGDIACFHRFESLLTCLKRSESLRSWEVVSLSVFVTGEEVRSTCLTKHLPRPAFRIKQSNLCFKMVPSWCYWSLLSHVFAAVHPEKLYLFPESDAPFLKSLCEQIAKGVVSPCCRHQRICWHRYFDGASFVSPEGLELGPVSWKTLSPLLPSFKRDRRPICFTLKWRVEGDFF